MWPACLTLFCIKIDVLSRLVRFMLKTDVLSVTKDTVIRMENVNIEVVSSL